VNLEKAHYGFFGKIDFSANLDPLESTQNPVIQGPLAYGKIRTSFFWSKNFFFHESPFLYSHGGKIEKRAMFLYRNF